MTLINDGWANNALLVLFNDVTRQGMMCGAAPTTILTSSHHITHKLNINRVWQPKLSSLEFNENRLECEFWPIAMLRFNHTDVHARCPSNFYQHFSYIFAWWCFISSHLNRSVSKSVEDSGDKASSMCTLPHIPAIPIESRLSHLWVLVFKCVQLLF